MRDLRHTLAEEEHFRYLIEKFETSDDPIAVELKAKILESAKTCPHNKSTCPCIRRAKKI